MKGTWWAVLCQRYNRAALTLPLYSHGAGAPCIQHTHWHIHWHTRWHKYTETTSSITLQCERYWISSQMVQNSPSVAFMGLWMSSLNGPSATQSLRRPYAAVRMRRLPTESTHNCTNPQPTCSVPTGTALLGVLFFFLNHTFTHASLSSMSGLAVYHVSICFCLRLRY